MTKTKNSLVRRIGILSLTATGICSMLGASINVVPFMIHRSVPGIGPYVIFAFIFAMIPALLAALAYSSLSSAMPRAGGSYIYASRGLNPYLGFIASFSQWFGLSIVIGVIAYIIVPFMRDVFVALEWHEGAALLEVAWIRIGIALFLIWLFVYINILGGKFYERTVVPLMFIMFLLGGIVIVTGFSFDQSTYLSVVEESLTKHGPAPFDLKLFLSAAAILFSSFIGFDAIAQAGGEAKSPTTTLPIAILLAIGVVGLFYFLYTIGVYRTVPWSYVQEQALIKDISAPGLIAPLLPAGLSVAILVGAAIALINDLPAMLLSVSRLVFAWSDDGIFPSGIAAVHKKHKTPHRALFLSGIMASIGVFGSHFAGDFFLGIDIMITSMMVNFLLMCLTLITIHKVNPSLSEKIKLIPSLGLRTLIGLSGVVLLVLFLVVHTVKDLNAEVTAWYFRSTPVWMIVMSIGSIIYSIKTQALRKAGKDLKTLFKNLPSE
ncbi:MAG: APC family permease [Cytophagales bacterium]|nr:APC family permease [Cytophagales bacterium]